MTESWAPLAFAEQEYVERQRRVREECARRGLDALLLFAQESLYYLLGYDQLGYWVYQTVLFPAAADAAVVAVARAPDELMIRQSPWVDDVRIWYDEAADGPGAMTRDVLAEAELLRPGTRIGIELSSHSLLPRYYLQLREALSPGVELVDASDLVAGMRIVKSPAEVERFCEAARYLAAAFAAVPGALQHGVRESDLHAAVVAAMYHEGADAPAIPPPIASGPRTLSQTHASASTRRIARGEPVVIEIGAAAARYHAVGAQCFVMDAPSPALARLHGALVEALEIGFQHIAPGRPVADVATTVQDALRSAGLSRAGRHVGYGTGIGYPPTWLEDLRIKTSDGRAFVPGMTFFYFAGVAEPDQGHCVYVGEPVLVTADGYERVARPAHDRWVQ